jgi:hypothetical protein
VSTARVHRPSPSPSRRPLHRRRPLYPWVCGHRCRRITIRGTRGPDPAPGGRHCSGIRRKTLRARGRGRCRSTSRRRLAAVSSIAKQEGQGDSHELEEQPSSVLAKQFCQHRGRLCSHKSRAALSANSCANTTASSAVDDSIFRLCKERNEERRGVEVAQPLVLPVSSSSCRPRLWRA